MNHYLDKKKIHTNKICEILIGKLSLVFNRENIIICRIFGWSLHRLIQTTKPVTINHPCKGLFSCSKPCWLWIIYVNKIVYTLSASGDLIDFTGLMCFWAVGLVTCFCWIPLVWFLSLAASFLAWVRSSSF